MDNSTLNKAHLEYRRAEALLRSKKFFEAIKCHAKAADLLSDALNTTENIRSVESIKLQKDFHVRQKDLILMQKKQYELRSSERSRTRHLPDAIHETLEKTDLLLVLLRKGGEADLESLRADGTVCDDGSNAAVMMMLKHAKDKYVVVEELVTLNEQLHAHVYSLVEQLETKEQQLVVLRERIVALETKANQNSAEDSGGGKDGATQ